MTAIHQPNRMPYDFWAGLRLREPRPQSEELFSVEIIENQMKKEEEERIHANHSHKRTYCVDLPSGLNL